MVGQVIQLFLVIFTLCVCLLCSGCQGILTSEGIIQTGYDFQRLFLIGYKLSDPHSLENNKEGLEMLSESFAAKVIRWYKATLGGIKAAKSMEDHLMPRDLYVRSIIYQYNHWEKYD